MFPFISWSHLKTRPTLPLIILASFFGQLFFFVPVMTPYLIGKGLSLVEVASMQTVLMLSMLIMEVPTGVVADRWGHRRSYQVALTLVALAELATLLAQTYPQFLIAQVIAGTGFACASGSVDALVYHALPDQDKTRAMHRAKGHIGASVHFASLVAYGVGGWITRELTMERMRFTLGLDVIFVGIGAAITFLLRGDTRAGGHAITASSLGLLRSGLGLIRTSAPLRRLILLAIVTNPFVAHLLIFYQASFVENRVPAVWLGWGLAIGSLVAIVTQLHAWRITDRLGTPRGMFVATALPGVLYLLMAVVHHPLLTVLLFIVQWGLVQMSAPLFSGLWNAHIADHARATTLSLINGLITVYISLGGVILGWVAGHSMSAVYAVLGAVICAGAVIVRLDSAGRSAAGEGHAA